MRIALRLCHPDGASVVGRAGSVVPADESTAGWHGCPLGVTDARGACDLRCYVVAFELRVAAVDPVLGQFSVDLRSFEQVIEVEVPGR